MSTPRPEERRLGLLQCPNAASRGWANSSVSNEAQEDDLLCDNCTVEEVVADQTTNTDVVQENLSVCHSQDYFAPDGDEDVPSKPVHVATVENHDASTNPAEAELQAKGTREAAAPTEEPNTSSVSKEVVSISLAGAKSEHGIDIDASKDEEHRLRKRLRSHKDKIDAIKQENKSLLHVSDEAANILIVKETTDRAAVTNTLELEQNISIEETKQSEIESQSLSETNRGINASEALNVSLEYEQHCSCKYCTNFESNKDELTESPHETCTNERGQILQITCCPNSTTQHILLGTIVGKTQVELLCDQTACLDEISQETDTADLVLDIFGYRLSNSTNVNSIYINRPEWTNPLPLCLICHASPTRKSKTLQVRFKSIYAEIDTKGKDDNYYSSHREESFQLIIHSDEQRCGCITFISDAWRNTSTAILNSIQKSNILNSSIPQTCEEETTAAQLKSNHDIILICGAKGVGKSTYLRYMVNRILSTSLSKKNVMCQRVAILDLDSGQPEFSPPGLLTLSIVSRPIVSDPPIHMVCMGKGNNLSSGNMTIEKSGVVENVVASYFLGDITSKSDPDTYIHMVNKLMFEYQKFITAMPQEDTMPLIINADGWVKGLGYEILSAVVGVCNPAHIVQINGNTKAKSFDMSSFHSDQEILQYQRRVYVVQSFDQYINQFMDHGNERGSLDSQSALTGPLLATASDHRSHRICAYFLDGCDKMSTLKSGIDGDDAPILFHKEKGLVDQSNIIGLRLASMLPYAVPFHSVKLYPPSGLLDSVTEINPVWGTRADVACNDVLDSFNGSIVGLGYEPDLPESSSSDTNYNSGTGVPILQCAGLGIIRSIDHKRGIFYVLTPVHPNFLSNVTSFVGGNIGLPFECVYRGIYSDSFPYLSLGQVPANVGLGAEVMKSRNHSGRKK